MLGRRKSSDIEDALAKLQLFSSLSTQDLGELASLCLRKQYAEGDEILEQGSTGLGLFLLISGRVEVFKDRQGHQIRLAELGKGDVLGEIALLDHQPRSASAVALEATECLLLTRDRFRSLLERRPRIAWALVPGLTQQIRDLQDQLLTSDERAAKRSQRPSATTAPQAQTQHTRPEPTTAATPPSDGGSCTATQAGATTESTHDHTPTPTLLQAQTALLMTGAVGVVESARLLETFLRAFETNAGILRKRPWLDTVRDLPASLMGASLSTWHGGSRIPGKMLDVLQQQLRPTSEADV